jgi:hypothetical protein
MPWPDDDDDDDDGHDFDHDAGTWHASDDLLDDEQSDGDMAPCPACGEAMFEDSPRCPHCGEYVSVTGTRPTWIVVTVLVCLAAALWWAVGGLR